MHRKIFLYVRVLSNNRLRLSTGMSKEIPRRVISEQKNGRDSASKDKSHTNPTTGQKCVWRWKNTDTLAAHTLTLTTTGTGSFRFGSTITGTSATAVGKTDYIGAIDNATDALWDVIAYSKGY